MAGHAILPGCMTEWHHDCSGRQEELISVSADAPEWISLGGVTCSCPCHAMAAEIDRLKAALAKRTAQDRPGVVDLVPIPDDPTKCRACGVDLTPEGVCWWCDGED